MVVLNNRIILWAIGFGLWLAETAYFGWNATPQSATEAWLDKFCLVLILASMWPGKRITVVITKKENV